MESYAGAPSGGISAEDEDLRLARQLQKEEEERELHRQQREQEDIALAQNLASDQPSISRIQQELKDREIAQKLQLAHTVPPPVRPIPSTPNNGLDIRSGVVHAPVKKGDHDDVVSDLARALRASMEDAPHGAAGGKTGLPMTEHGRRLQQEAQDRELARKLAASMGAGDVPSSSGMNAGKGGRESCAACRAPLEPDDNFCPECGTPAPANLGAGSSGLDLDFIAGALLTQVPPDQHHQHRHHHHHQSNRGSSRTVSVSSNAEEEELLAAALRASEEEGARGVPAEEEDVLAKVLRESEREAKGGSLEQAQLLSQQSFRQEGRLREEISMEQAAVAESELTACLEKARRKAEPGA
mmetsp:Transcript_69121/g.104224  ORF Transcript_69121/g.104224 Transcript_69121/m.104224 type:complete len:355 (+) Transcript_69121:159-1223(+)